MAPPPDWADLPTDILTSVADRLHALTDYVAARGVCTAWRSALPPGAPSLIVAGVHSGVSASSCRPFRLLTLPRGSQCIGACHGWVAIAYSKPGRFYRILEQSTDDGHVEEKKSYYYRNFEGEQIQLSSSEVAELQNQGCTKSFMALLNPVTGRRIDLPEHVRLEPRTVSKVVFAPNPRNDDFTVVVAFGWNSLAYISTRDDGGACWSFGEVPGETLLADMVYRDGGGSGDSVYCLAQSGDVHVLRVPHGRRTKPVIEPLVPELAGYHSVNPSYVFPPPHDRLSEYLMGAKSLAFCGGDLYQVWRNTIGGTIRVKLPGDGGFLAVHKDEVFVLRYNSSRRPCWTVAADLGGHAVFIGPGNSAASMRAEGVPGLKGDCVYWLRRFGNKTAYVFDMRTRRSTSCLSLSAGVGVPICWYSLGGDGEILQRQQKRKSKSLTQWIWLKHQLVWEKKDGVLQWLKNITSSGS